MRDQHGNELGGIADAPVTETLQLSRQGSYRQLPVDASRKLGDTIDHPKYGHGLLVEITTQHGKVVKQLWRFGR